MKKHKENAEKTINNIMYGINPAVLYTAIAILVVNYMANELIQLGIFLILLVIIVVQKHDSRIPIESVNNFAETTIIAQHQ